MLVKELKQKLDKMDDNVPVVIETTQGQKYQLLTAKKHTLHAGHSNKVYCWLPTGEKITAPSDLAKS